MSYRDVFGFFEVAQNPTTEALAQKMQQMYSSLADAGEVADLLTKAKEMGKIEDAVRVLDQASEECSLLSSGRQRSATLRRHCREAISGWG